VRSLTKCNFIIKYILGKNNVKINAFNCKLKYKINIFFKKYLIFFKIKNNIIIYNILQIISLSITTKKLFSNKIKKFYKINKNIIKILKINKANFIKIYSLLLFYKKVYIL